MLSRLSKPGVDRQPQVRGSTATPRRGLKRPDGHAHSVEVCTLPIQIRQADLQCLKEAAGDSDECCPTASRRGREGEGARGYGWERE